MGGGGGGFNPIKAITAPIQTVTHSIGAAIDSAKKGDVIGAASSLGNAVNPVALSESVATGKVTTNSTDTFKSLQGTAQQAVQVVSKETGLSPQQIQSGALTYATGGLVGLPDFGDLGGEIASGLTNKFIGSGSDAHAIGPSIPSGYTSVVPPQLESKPSILIYIIPIAIAGAALLILKKGKK